MIGERDKEFGFGIRVVTDSEGRERCQAIISNRGVSLEIIAMQLKAYLRLLEDNYADDFKNTSTRFTQE